MSTHNSPPRRRTVLVTGANGFLGSAAARAFARAGWTTFGLIRRPASAANLHLNEIIPVIGSSADPEPVISALRSQVPTLDVIVSTTEQLPDYDPHYRANMALFRALAEQSGKNGVRPLLMFTSGCKDGGQTGVHGSPGLVPYTEDSPLAPPPFAVARAAASEAVLTEQADLMEVLSTRPTPLWGHEGSFYGVLLGLAAAAKEQEVSGKGEGWDMPVDRNTIIHGMHVDDCGEAYVALAEAERQKVRGKVFNISGWRYETFGEVVEAVRKEYEISGPVRWEDEGRMDEVMKGLMAYSQWVGSQRIREEVGWKDKRPLFSESVAIHRRSYEEWMRAGGDNQKRIQRVIQGAFRRSRMPSEI